MPNTSLYDAALERASCGLGMLARVDGRPSHEIVEQALEVLTNMAHRGASGSDEQTGDGAGILLQIPHSFLHAACRRAGWDLPNAGGYAVGMLFLPVDPEVRVVCRRVLEEIVAEEGQRVLGWRDVPVNPDAIGRDARTVAPVIQQVFIERRVPNERDFARTLYHIRRRFHWAVRERFGGDNGCYVVSLSARTIVYKGLLRGPQVGGFYNDLHQPGLTSALALVHSRFSTNTLGSWELAHPYRYVAHNGEINTVRGNINWMRARERELQSALFEPGTEHLGPIVQPGGSDSAAFDNALEFLVLAGRSLPHAVMTMVPEAWEKNDDMDEERRAFYSYNSSLMPPWDGPAGLAFSDGTIVGAALDRNGLRPARYSITRDGLVVLASEEGALRLPPEDVVSRWRLLPGRMLLVDTARGCILDDDRAKAAVVRRHPYSRWIAAGTVRLTDLPQPQGEDRDRATLTEQQRAFGYTLEDLKIILHPMAAHAKEADSSMGTDTPPAVLSERPQLLFSYFQQLFAQVTNPPIDPIREVLVMSLQMSLGAGGNLLDEGANTCRRILLDGPVLTDDELERVRALGGDPFRTRTLSLLFPVVNDSTTPLDDAVERLCAAAEAEVRSGINILVLSDRGVDAEHGAIPILLATAAVHHHLVRVGLRTRTGLVVETGEAREVHHVALLIGFGAAAVNPYLALRTAVDLAETGEVEGISAAEAVSNYRSAVHKGLLKVISKMGISTLISYCGAQVFEAVGLHPEFIERYFTGTASRIGGIGSETVYAETMTRHAAAFSPFMSADLDVGGEVQLRPNGEFHQWSPAPIAALQRAVRSGNFHSFSEYTAHFDAASAKLATLRGLFEFRSDPIPLAEVEPAPEIVKRFSTGAMSFGSISREAHETLAIAMNGLSGKSNTGEGGEEPERFVPDADGTSRRSAIKQVASARFGVTAHYLVNADMLQIKMAQGSKPGEGGQLPGHKVSPAIARVRNSTPGVGLISPPPHHDIYSIEDLAQLIHDLRCVNPEAAVSVKLVSEVGVGTIAAGVVKAKADHITIAGHDGGTGASPLSSIKHAGLPWELGLAETQQVLVANNLRSRVTLQADGHLKTGRDVVVAALLGADEFAFSTAPLVAVGCIMMRACHLNTCPVGIATQDPVLRERFAGKPEHVVNFFFALAEEVRALMASLGFRRFDDMVGRVDKLGTRTAIDHWKARTVNLTALLAVPVGSKGTVLHHTEPQHHAPQHSLDGELLAECAPVLERRGAIRIERTILNTDRTVGAAVSGAIVRRFGAEGLPDDSIHVELRGIAGQSFGAWGARGLTLVLEGETNDYAGKGLSGARIVVTPPATAGYDPERSIVTGNVALYGATSGEAYFRGVAGERFAVRNSGAEAVVEGVGDHGCEYMTGGVVVVLGPTGRNFAAGMSGGNAYVLDLWGRFASSCNTDMVALESIENQDDIAVLRRLVKRHVDWTGSTIGQRVLANWPEYLPRFVKVMPHDLRRVLAQRAQEPTYQPDARAV